MTALRFTSLASLLALLTLVAAIAPRAASAQEGAGAGQPRLFELRTYTAEKGKLEALERRFRDHTLRLFAKHGMEVIGFWKPVDDEGESNRLVYLLAFPSQQARDAAWSAFGKDPEWQQAYAESHRDGPLVKKVESIRLDPTEYSPLR
jgi:hypothetical protein